MQELVELLSCKAKRLSMLTWKVSIDSLLALHGSCSMGFRG